MPDEAGTAQVTADHLLGGRVRLRQPAEGYRVAIDPVFLAAAVPIRAGERVLDAGAGTGAASLCLATRVPDCRIVGLERQRDLARLASDNVADNGLGDRVDMMAGDLERPPPRLVGGSFDHLMTNPPYLPADAVHSPVAGRAQAHVEAGLDLAAWISACLRMVKPGGGITLIHRAERLAEVLAALVDRAGNIEVMPLWPGGRGKPAKRVVVRGRKGHRGPLRLLPGLVLHQQGGQFTPAADAILRQGQAFDPTDDAGPDDG